MPSVQRASDNWQQYRRLLEMASVMSPTELEKQDLYRDLVVNGGLVADRDAFYDDFVNPNGGYQGFMNMRASQSEFFGEALDYFYSDGDVSLLDPENNPDALYFSITEELRSHLPNMLMHKLWADDPNLSYRVVDLSLIHI